VSARARLAGWSLVAALAAVSLVARLRMPPGERAGSLPLRLLGPIASAAASAQWVRVQSALRDGRTDLALARGQTALELDPGATSGWLMLAAHMAFERASPERGPNAARRLAWVRAALELAARGEMRARDPQRIALWQGLVLSKLAREDEPLDWPGGVRGMWLAAAAHFERAEALGSEHGAVLAANARRAAEEAR
jgi:hypothetical protein